MKNEHSIDPLEYLIAQAINGPFDFNGVLKKSNSKYSLQEIRDAKWMILSSSEKQEKLNEARSVILTLKEKGIDLKKLFSIELEI